MIVTGPCGHTFDDEHYSYTCYGDEGHWPLFTSPETYCKNHDLHRPCAGCDEGIGAGEAMRRDHE
jgi:hypothetical protein